MCYKQYANMWVLFVISVLNLLGFASPIWGQETPPPLRILLGIDALEGQRFEALRGKQVGLITNQTGVDSKGRSTADVLAKAPGVKLIALFSPEHGIRGKIEHGQSIGDTIDPKLHLPVYSLYGPTQRPTSEMFNAVDVMVFDIQDVGTRFYTYLTTMGMAMEAAAKRGIEFMVLDRPNPLGGAIVEGLILDPKIRHFTAYFSIPVRHGFTAGELAQWYNQTAKVGCKLKVIPMIGWKRDHFWDDIDLTFIPPSPNIQSPTQALLYTGLGMFEATNLSAGRGTPTPFEVIGAPWIKGHNLLHRLKSLSLPGVKFHRVEFTPKKDLYEGQLCTGVRLEVMDEETLRPVDLFTQIAIVLRELYPNDFQLRWEEVARVTGSTDFERQYKTNQPAGSILDLFHKSAAEFEKDRQSYLLY